MSSGSSRRRSEQPPSISEVGDTFSIGQVSVEAQPWQSSTSVASAGSEKGKPLRNARSMRNLRMKPSTDSFRMSLSPRKDDGEISPKKQRLFLSDSRSPSPARRDIDMPKRRSRASKLEHSKSMEHIPTPKTREPPLPSTRPVLDGEDEASREGSTRRSSLIAPGPDAIPRRNSSMRHSRKSSGSHRKRRSRLSQPENGSVDTPKVDDEVPALPDSRPATADAAALGEEESQVLRRIRQLKEQQEERRRLSMSDSPDSPRPPATGELSPSPLSTGVKKSSKSRHTPIPSGPPSAHEISPISTSSKRFNFPQRSAPPSEPQSAQESSPVSTNAKRFNFPQRSALSNEPWSARDSAAGQGSPRDEPSAPPPTVRTTPFRSVTDSAAIRASSVGLRTPAGHTPAGSRDDTRSASFTHTRRNSQLLKRLSQAASPMTNEKQRRRLSNPVQPVLRTDSYRAESVDSIDDSVDKYIAAPRLSQTCVDPATGRVISFSEVGDPKGSVVFCCVGMGLTRYITAFYDELAATLKLRLITPDRPGVGGSEAHADGQDTPLNWPDDVKCICEHLNIVKFSILAHSAGAIYALATALRMPQQIRCRVHLLAPWIPPSQLSAIGTQQEPLPANALPYSQRVLRSLPTPFLKAANSSFFSISSLTTSLPKSPKRAKRRAVSRNDGPKATTPGEAATVGNLADDASNGLEKENLPQEA